MISYVLAGIHAFMLRVCFSSISLLCRIIASASVTVLSSEDVHCHCLYVDVVNYDEGGGNHDACKVEQERVEAQQQAEDKQTEVEVDEMK